MGILLELSVVGTDKVGKKREKGRAIEGGQDLIYK